MLSCLMGNKKTGCLQGLESAPPKMIGFFLSSQRTVKTALFSKHTSSVSWCCVTAALLQLELEFKC